MVFSQWRNSRHSAFWPADLKRKLALDVLPESSPVGALGMYKHKGRSNSWSVSIRTIFNAVAAGLTFFTPRLGS